tara:strand:+ start:945 stop:1742 length:798 start_codon:yes stop_codon:yes gene_type:complete
MSELETIHTYDLTRYDNMMSRVQEVMPRVMESSESFGKSSSQLKTVTLDITDLTDVGAAKHILASINRTRQALKESEIAVRRKRLDLTRKQAAIETATGFDVDEILIDITELESQLEDTMSAQRGAVRKLAYLIEQYDSICQRLGVDVITEAMYEADQGKYHVMRAFSQGLAAARARGGTIDEGNFIYFQDLGVNGAAAQRELTAYFAAEQDMLNKGQVPTFEMQANWLEAVGEKFAGEVSRYAASRGFVPVIPEVFAQAALESK